METIHRSRWQPLVAGLAVLALAACGGGDGGGAADGGDGETAEAAGPVVPPDSQATVSGQISFEGAPPEAQPIDMSAEEKCVRAYGDEGPMTQHVLVSNGQLANVFVYVKSAVDRDFPTPSEPVSLDQQNCRYHPHVLGIQAGQDLRILNSDSLLHNINAQPSTNRGFNISQPQAGMATTRSFSLQEVMIPVKCDVHGWMNAYIGVLEHPYYAVSSSDGSFSLEGLPPGEHVIEAWHERYGVQEDTVTVAAGGSASVSFTFSEDMAGAEVPLGEPLVVHADGTTSRGE